MQQKRAARIMFVVSLMLIAGVSLVNLIARPRFHTYNVMDVVQTAGIGVCFGVAVTVVLGFSRKTVGITA